MNQNSFKHLTLIAALLVMTFGNVFAQDDSATNTSDEVSNELPDITLSNLEGEDKNVKAYGENGKMTIFAFWATWCGPCKKELNNISEMYEDWQDDYNVEVIAVSTDDARTAPKVKPYVDGSGWEYEVLMDTNEDMKRALNIPMVPYTLVTNHAGEIVYEKVGYKEGDEYHLEDVIVENAATETDEEEGSENEDAKEEKKSKKKKKTEDNEE